MSAKETSIPAFPVLPPIDDAGQTPAGYPYPDSGMTLRDYFAAKAMQALLTGGGAYNSREISQLAFRAADAMLKARAEG